MRMPPPVHSSLKDPTMKRTIALAFGVAILASAAALPAIARGGHAGHGTGPGSGSHAWKSGYGCASGLRKC
jgi:hypothetical protein